MNPESALREKLRKIEALFAGAATHGEKAAAAITHPLATSCDL